MNSTPPPNETGPHDAPTAGTDERLAHAHEEIKRADKQLTRLTEQLAKMERDTAGPPSTRPDPKAPSGGSSKQLVLARTAPPPRSSGKPSLGIIFGLALAAGVVVAALVMQLSYDDETRPAAQLASAPSPPPESPSSPAQKTAATLVQIAAAEPAPTQAASSPPAALPQAPTLAQAAPSQAAPSQATPPQDAPPAAAASPDQTQLLQTMARNLGNLERTIDQLKSSQQQMADDNAKAIGELKATQEEMKRALAKVSEPAPPKVSAPATRPAPSVRRPERAAQSPPARSRPRYRREWIYDDDW